MATLFLSTVARPATPTSDGNPGRVRLDNRWRRAIARALAVCVTLVASGCRSGDAPTSALDGTDLASIRALDTAFVNAWLRDDTAGVLRLFDPAAILLPPGAAPVAGLAAIKAYWWPSDGSHTRITAFSRDVAEIDGTRRLAFLRATASLAWVSPGSRSRTPHTSRSTDLVLVSRDSIGHWRIVRQMWSPLPP